MMFLCQWWCKSSRAGTLHVDWVHGNRSSPGTEGEDRGLPHSLTLLRTPKHSWGWRRQGTRARQGWISSPPVKGGRGFFKGREAQYFLSTRDWTATIFKCSRKLQNYPTSPPPPKIFFLPQFCSEYFHTSRRVFSDIRFCLHCSGGCCGLGLKGPGFPSAISPRMLGSLSLSLWPRHHHPEMQQQSPRSSCAGRSPVEGFVADKGVQLRQACRAP